MVFPNFLQESIIIQLQLYTNDYFFWKAINFMKSNLSHFTSKLVIIYANFLYLNI